MKKFLFTLAALLMAGSAFAAEVTTIDHEFTADEIGKVFLLPINLTVDNEYINGWDFTMTYPEGLTVGTVKVNSVLTQMVPSNADGDLAVVSPMGEAKPEHIVGAYGTAGYWDEDEDGVFESYGAVKLGPTGTIKMYEIRITPTAEFTGGDVTIEWMVSGGFDLRNGQDGSLKVNGTAVAHLTVAAAPAQPAPVPTFDWSDQSFTMEAVCENHTVVLMKGDEIVSNPFTVTQTYEEQEITFKAYTVANDDESGNSAVIDTTVVVPAKAKTPSQKPNIVVTPGEDKYTIEATGDGTVKLYLVDGETLTEVNNPYEVTRGDADVTLTFIASNLDTDPENEVQYEIAWSAEKEVVIPAKVVEPKVYETPEPNIVVTDDPDNERVIVKVTGEGALHVDIVGGYNNIHEDGTEPELIVYVPYGDAEDMVNIHATALANLPAGYDEVTGSYADENYVVIPAKTPTLAGQIVFSEVNQDNGQFTVKYVGDEAGVTITLDDETIELVRDVENKYQLPTYGTYEVTATAAATGYKSIDKDATLVWTKTEPAEKPGVPEIKQVLGETTVTVSAEAENAEEVHMYKWDPTANNGEGDFVYGEDGKPVEIENPTTYNMGDEPQTFYVMAVATNDAGETWTTNYATVVIPANPATGVDELVNGKTVAGVRYFNMAGQEMQEANGVTIVVTTYTDGTTSAVKVIK